MQLGHAQKILIIFIPFSPKGFFIEHLDDVN